MSVCEKFYILNLSFSLFLTLRFALSISLSRTHARTHTRSQTHARALTRVRTHAALCQCARSEKTDTEKRIERLLRVKYESLGKVKFAEIVIMVLFFVLVVLWFTRDFGFAPGYGSLFEDVVNITTKVYWQDWDRA